MKLSHLNGLRALESTLRNGTFTAAAEEMGVTVAAVGQQIRGLEDYLGLKLFDRLPQGAVPTREAKSIAERLTNGFTQIGDALEELSGSRSRVRLNISMSYFFLDDWLSGRLPGFQETAKDVELNFHTGEDYVDLFGGDFDMAIRFSPEPGKELAFDYLHSGYMFPVCTPQYAAEHNLTPDCKDLTGVTLFRLHDATLDEAWIGWDKLIDIYCMKREGGGPVEHISGQGSVRAGAGLMLSGLTESFNDLADGRLVAPLGPNWVRPFNGSYRLVWAAGRSQTRAMKKFRDWIAQENRQYLSDASKILGKELS